MTRTQHTETKAKETAMSTITFTYPDRIQQDDGTWKTIGVTTHTVPVLDRRLRPYQRGYEVLIDNPVLKIRHWIDEDNGTVSRANA